MSGDDISYQEIVDQLRDMAGHVAETCVPAGKRVGSKWEGDLHGKLTVHVAGSKAGMVGYWQGQHVANPKGGGNLISLIELAFNCKNHGEAVRLAKEKFLGIGRRELTPEEKRRWAQQQEESKRKAEARRAADERTQAAKIETVQSIWKKAVPIVGTPAEEYLRSRSIELSDFPAGTGWMPSLRYHPSVELRRGEHHPALIGGVQAKDRRLTAIWRIFLTPEGKALLDADGKKIKLGLGPAAGGAVRLAPVGPVLRLAEGMETSLAVMLLTGCKLPVWATLSTSGMTGFQIPDEVKRLEIYADGDRHRENVRTGGVMDPPGVRAARQLQERAISEGREAVVLPSPEPDDWLDVWMQRKKDEQRQRLVQYCD